MYLEEKIDRLFKLCQDIGERINKLETNSSEENEYVNVKDAAKMLGVKLGTLRNKMSQGHIKYYKPGKNVFFSKKYLTEYISSNEMPVKENVKKFLDTPNIKESN